ncbi:MAG: DUF3541 domain-containing protein [candidate division Zixibacteria bacterium]|nr:DUF3541 domain-containing protein [candidate division Zixibacteria bacterium]
MAIALVIGLPGYFSTGFGAESKEVMIAQAIRQTFDRSLSSFEQEIQRHYALRMYRLTGDTTYLPTLRQGLALTLSELEADVVHASDSVYIGRRMEELLEPLRDDNRKDRLRLPALRDLGPFLYHLHLLENTAKIREYRLTDSVSTRLCGQADSILRTVDFSPLMDTQVIRVYAPQAANFVWWLYAGKGADLRDQFMERFRSLYPDSLDARLKGPEYLDKLYGLTHLILPVSEYFQHNVHPEPYRWVLDYFRANKKRIMKSATSDIIAEIGICFLMCDMPDDPMVAECRHRIVADFDKRSGFILSPSGNRDMSTAEHRNVLAFALLAWPERLFPGPYLTDYVGDRKNIDQ